MQTISLKVGGNTVNMSTNLVRISRGSPVKAWRVLTRANGKLLPVAQNATTVLPGGVNVTLLYWKYEDAWYM